MADKKLVVNYIYNLLYQFLNILIPVVTIPYISRVLKLEGIGINSYTYSITIMFAGVCIFGITNYGVKNIAYVRDNKKKLSSCFWGIWYVQLFMSFISIAIFLGIFVGADILDMKKYFILQFPFLLAALFDISWFFIGIEDFKKTVLRNLAVKLLGLLLIFVLVKDITHLNRYIVINSSINLLGNLSFWMFLSKYISWSKFSFKVFKIHFYGAFLLFIPQLAIQIYTVMDRAIIGEIGRAHV